MGSTSSSMWAEASRNRMSCGWASAASRAVSSTPSRRSSGICSSRRDPRRRRRRPLRPRRRGVVPLRGRFRTLAERVFVGLLGAGENYKRTPCVGGAEEADRMSGMFDADFFIAVIVATIVSFVIGGIWYGPAFGEAWMGALGKAGADMEGMRKRAPQGVGAGVVGAVIAA